MSEDDRRAAARAALAGPGFAPLWGAARRRLEGGTEQLSGGL